MADVAQSARSFVPAPNGPAALARSRGTLSLTLHDRLGVTRIASRREEGCLRVRFPRGAVAAPVEAVVMNTAGGLTGGDIIKQEFEWGEQARGAITTLTAEKIYRSLGSPVYVTTKIRIAANADVEWLPQETILFDRSDLDRTLDVEMSADATFLAVEIIVFGRTAMGETMTEGRLADRWRIRRNGRLIYADSLRLEGSPQTMLDLPAVGNGARAVATLLFVAHDAGARLEALRAVVGRVPDRSAASSWNGLLVARFLASDGAALRQNLLPALASLRGERALPSAWSC